MQLIKYAYLVLIFLSVHSQADQSPVVYSYNEVCEAPAAHGKSCFSMQYYYGGFCHLVQRTTMGVILEDNKDYLWQLYDYDIQNNTALQLSRGAHSFQAVSKKDKSLKFKIAVMLDNPTENSSDDVVDPQKYGCVLNMTKVMNKLQIK